MIPNFFKTHFLHALTQYKNYLLIYTDAFKTINGVGACFLTSHEHSIYKLSPETSIFTDELSAIIKALTFILKKKLPKSLILLAVMTSISQVYPSHPTLQQIKLILYHIYQNNLTVEFFWVPSHVGINGNEKAARSAVTSTASSVENLTVHLDLKPYLKAKLHDVWQNQWNTSNTKLVEIKSSVLPWNFWPPKR
uniref:Uncharacterized protein LOC114332505 n=1 Tax=Diabrotica virgifera virgifera TaxID=50390 RepID=A0A6P7FTJ1_DIAVI